jgi:biopolymer transport protein ExbB
MKPLLPALALMAALLPTASHAWWDEAWTQRTRITLDTTAAGVAVQEAAKDMAVPVRLHSGNFDFLGAKPDGSDLRVVAADDKTPLPFWVERWDATNELAVVWVKLPQVLPGSDQNLVHIYAGNEQAPAQATQAQAVLSGATLAAVSFAGANANEPGPATDATGAWASTGPAAREANGFIGTSARLLGQPLVWPAGSVRAAAGAPYSVSFWLRPDAAPTNATLLAQGALRIAVESGKLAARVGDVALAAGELPASAWTQLALTVGGGKATLYVNGTQAAQADLPASPAIEGELRLGEGFTGLVDELQIASTARSADWVRLAHAAQGADAKLMLAAMQTPDSADDEGGGDHGYMGILVSNLTVDAWVVIVICGLMLLVAVWVMVSKAVLVARADADNRRFLARFREARDVMAVGEARYAHSSLQRLYQAGLRELKKRDVGQPGAPALSGASIDAVKAAVDADLVRETHTLNAKMVLLTIAISGGPFLGLLGTVVGVMITFAAIAAAGDVNVNAIAPGIAAALLATVAGLGVAIPALFGYNYLAARIKNISSDMQIFVDEFVTRVAETHGAR